MSQGYNPYRGQPDNAGKFASSDSSRVDAGQVWGTVTKLEQGDTIRTNDGRSVAISDVRRVGLLRRRVYTTSDGKEFTIARGTGVRRFKDNGEKLAPNRNVRVSKLSPGDVVTSSGRRKVVQNSYPTADGHYVTYMDGSSETVPTNNVKRLVSPRNEPLAPHTQNRLLSSAKSGDLVKYKDRWRRVALNPYAGRQSQIYLMVDGREEAVNYTASDTCQTIAADSPHFSTQYDTGDHYRRLAEQQRQLRQREMALAWNPF